MGIGINKCMDFWIKIIVKRFEQCVREGGEMKQKRLLYMPLSVEFLTSVLPKS